jgi:hypothetical protein
MWRTICFSTRWCENTKVANEVLGAPLAPLSLQAVDYVMLKEKGHPHFPVWKGEWPRIFFIPEGLVRLTHQSTREYDNPVLRISVKIAPLLFPQTKTLPNS